MGLWELGQDSWRLGLEGWSSGWRDQLWIGGADMEVGQGREWVGLGMEWPGRAEWRVWEVLRLGSELELGRDTERMGWSQGPGQGHI